MLFNGMSFDQLMIFIPLLVITFSVHELCHGLMAYVLGDSTAKNDGRLSLNPIRHIDPIGFLCILLIGFGWAKPVMVNPHNLKNPKVHMALIAAAGPLSNFILAFITAIIITPIALYFNVPLVVEQTIFQFIWINSMLGVFNLLPIPPLDGSKIIMGFLPKQLYNRLPSTGIYGMIFLMVLVMTGVTRTVLIPLTQTITFGFFDIALNIFG